jgi:hypothetical protein
MCKSRYELGIEPTFRTDTAAVRNVSQLVRFSGKAANLQKFKELYGGNSTAPEAAHRLN